jgi:hypothetical protein
MTREPFTISVVIPAHNEESRIPRALASVLNQHRRASEIIVVDDGSVDCTDEVVKTFGDQVVYLHQENKGLAAARNAGILSAKCTFIAFLDADDEWLPGHLQEAVRVLSAASNVHWFCAAFECRKERGETQFFSRVGGSLIRDGVITDYFEAQALHSFSLPSTMVVRKRVFDKVGLFNVEISQFGEDLDMWFRIALRYPEIGYSSQPGCIYWRRAGSITSTEKVDIKRFLRRIDATQHAAVELGPSAVRRASRLTVKWITQAVRLAVKQNDRAALKEIGDKYEAQLPPVWRLATRVFSYGFFRMAAARLFALKRTLGQ